MELERLEYSSNRGKHPNSLAALELARENSLKKRRENREIKLKKKELELFKKSEQTLDLELEIKRMNERKKENRRLEKLMKEEEAKYRPLNKTQLLSVLNNVFNN